MNQYKLFFACFFTLFLNFSFLKAQNSSNKNLVNGTKITGTITDEISNSKLDFAAVVLSDQKIGKTIKSAQSNLEGIFSFDNIAFGNYQIKITFVGYQSYLKQNIVIDENSKVVNLGILKLKKSKDAVLKEVVVTSKKDAITLGIDRKVFNADQSLVAQGGSATDLLATVPSVQVDLDGNISLRGTSNVRILIDGKPSTFGGSNITQLLQSLPANSIERVELVTNPSSKYDPEGQSGLINIVLKRNIKTGLNGNFSVSAGRLENYNANTSLNYRNLKWNLSSNYGLRTGDRLGFGINNTDFLNANSGLINSRSNTNSFSNDISHTLKLGADYYLTEKTTIGVAGNLNLNNESGNEILSQRFLNLNNSFDSGNGNNLNTEDGYGYDLNLDLVHKFKTLKEELTGNFSFGNSNEDNTENIIQNYLDVNDNLSNQRQSTNRRNLTFEDNKSYNIQLDYTKPLTEKSKLEAGFRSALRYNDVDQTSDTLIFNTPNFNRDNNLTSLFELEDLVHAVYGNYQNQFTNNFGVQIGLRAEQAYLNTDITGITTGGGLLSSPGRLDYFRIYPSVFITQKFKGDNQLQLSYSRRVNRPRGWQVNPFPDVADRFNIRIGNPNLRPEDIHSFEFSYAKFLRTFTFTSSLYFRQVNDVVQGLREQNPNQIGGTISRYFNIARNQSFGLELISRKDITKTWNVTGNLNFFQTYFKGDENLGINDNDGFNWNGNLTTNATIAKKLSVQANLFYMAPRTLSQGRMKEMVSADAGLRYDILKNKGSLAFNVRDVFNSRFFGLVTDNGLFIQDWQRRRQGQMYTLTFSYRFGNQDAASQKKPQRRSENSGNEEEGV